MTAPEPAWKRDRRADPDYGKADRNTRQKIRLLLETDPVPGRPVLVAALWAVAETRAPEVLAALCDAEEGASCGRGRGRLAREESAGIMPSMSNFIVSALHAVASRLHPEGAEVPVVPGAPEIRAIVRQEVAQALHGVASVHEDLETAAAEVLARPAPAAGPPADAGEPGSAPAS